MTRDRVIRPLTLAETELLLGWAQAEGWNPGLADAPAFQAADPDGLIGCFVGGEMAAGISAVRYGSHFGFIGLYICRPEARGKGYGRAVWDAGMAYLEGRTIGLDGVPEQQANYASMGFAPVYETVRWSGNLAGSMIGDVTDATPEAAAAIVAYDRSFFPSERSAFLAEWLKQPRIGKVVLRKGKIAGYAVCRECHDGWKIGPLFADGLSEAELLLSACAAEARGKVFHIDVPRPQATFSQRLEALGFFKGFTTARMYRGAKPAVLTDGIFGVTTLELG
jgi:hypothetical protein